ncbi:hypothetical protein EJF36_05900 [Bacillus sp. HMF5848]|uniref:sensor histidine kinase n=1 Tax=Bacillus sp. HMF5848 TaxID=2495421 RepID=UPI000F768E6A|nr:hypothetical protein [Bacillus sp. HMF5848]RSK26427.1 hypothetical protein EJF36_05900 [Bacillus sp. HMF5848]
MVLTNPFSYRINSIEPLTKLYRYVSLIITSLFYLVGEPASPIIFKIGVVVALAISSHILVNNVLPKTRFDNNIGLKLCIIVETLGVSLLLIPTGGIESPFIWYALNPILLAASYLSAVSSWVLLIFYNVIAFSTYSILFNSEKLKITQIIKEHSYLFLVFILIAVFMQLFSELTKTIQKKQNELQQANNKLIEVNHESKAAVEHIMSLYQSVESLSNETSLTKLCNEVADYCVKLTSNAGVFVYIHSPQTLIVKSDDNDIKTKIHEYVNSYSGNEELLNDFSNEFVLGKMKSVNIDGVIGVYNQESKGLETTARFVKFLSELVSIIIDRMQVDRISEIFKMTEEKNRLIREIHERVHQLTFSAICSMQALKLNTNKYNDQIVTEEIEAIIKSLKVSIEELRSEVKIVEHNYLQKTLKKYLLNFSNLNEVKVDFKIYGEEDFVSLEVKKNLYQVVRQMTGVSLRYGNATGIQIQIEITKETISLDYEDNGLYENETIEDIQEFNKILSWINDIEGTARTNKNHNSLLLNATIPVNENNDLEVVNI